jgi:hypothetical protein
MRFLTQCRMPTYCTSLPAKPGRYYRDLGISQSACQTHELCHVGLQKSDAEIAPFAYASAKLPTLKTTAPWQCTR